MVVIPAGKKVRFLITANDVIHSWWMPAFAIKQDAIPGFVNTAWTVVDEPGLTDLIKGQIISEDQYIDYQDQHGEDSFSASIGAEAIEQMLQNIDLQSDYDQLKQDLTETKSELKKAKITKRLKLIETTTENPYIKSTAEVKKSEPQKEAEENMARDRVRHFMNPDEVIKLVDATLCVTRGMDLKAVSELIALFKKKGFRTE